MPPKRKQPAKKRPPAPKKSPKKKANPKRPATKKPSPKRSAKPKPPAPSKSPAETLIRLQKEAADILGVSAPGLHKWEKEPDFPDFSRGYPIEQIREWIQRTKRKGSTVTEQLLDLKRDGLEEDVACKRVKRERMQLKLRAEQGELLPRRGWELFAATLLTQLADLAEQLPDLVAQQCTPNCRVAVREFLATNLDSWRNDTADALTAGPADQPSPLHS